MDQTYNIGFVKTPSVKTLSETKQALVDAGVVNMTVPSEALPGVLSENLSNLKPENIKNNIKIGNVKGEFVGDSIELLENLDPNQCEQQLNLNRFSNVYFAKNGKDAYASYISTSFDNDTLTQREAGIFHINLETNVITKVYDSGIDWRHFIEGNNNDVYVSSSSSSAPGVISLNGDQPAYMTYSSGYRWSRYVVDDEGNMYVASSVSGSEATFWGMLYIRNNGVCIKIQNSESTQTFVIVKDKHGNIYAAANSSSSAANSSYPAGVIRLEGGKIIKVAVDPNDAKKYFYLQLVNGVAYTSNANTPLSILSGDSLIQIQEAKASQYYSKILDDDVHYLIHNKQIIYVHNDQYTIIPVPEGISVNSSSTSTMRTMYVNGTPSLLIGDTAGSIYQVMGTSFKKIYTESKTTSYNILSYYNKMFMSANGDIYLGTTNSTSVISGILRIRDGVATIIATTDVLPSKNMYCKYVGHVDPDGNVYIKYRNSSSSLSTNIYYPITIVSPNGEFSYSSKVPEYYDTFIDAPGGGVYHSYGRGINPDLPIYLLKDGVTYTLQPPLKKE